jgi:hypothetical protein
LAANGEVTRLADLDGNVLLETVQSAQGKTPALAVFEAAGGAGSGDHAMEGRRPGVRG